MGEITVSIKVLRSFIGAHPNVKAKVRKVSDSFIVSRHCGFERYHYLSVENMERVSDMVITFTSEHHPVSGIFV